MENKNDIDIIKEKIISAISAGPRLRSAVLMPMFKKYSVDEYYVLEELIQSGMVKDERCMLSVAK